MGLNSSKEERRRTVRTIQATPPPRGVQMPENPFVRERVFEDLFLSGKVDGIDAKPPPSAIKEVLLLLDKDDDLQIIFETSTHNYGFLVLLESTSSLSWKECQAIRDVLKLSEKGTAATNEMFQKWTEALQQKYGSVKLTQSDNRALIVVKPGGVNSQFREGNIVKCSFSEGNGDMTLQISTGIFSAKITLSTPFTSLRNPPGLSILDCRCLAYLFDVFETGDSMSEDKFMLICAKLTAEYNAVSASKTGTTFEVKIRPTRQDELCTPSPLLQSWIRDQESNNPAPATPSQTRSVPVHPHPLTHKLDANRWRCDAPSIHGSCVSGITDFDKGKGKERWRCDACDFDLCTPCLNRSSGDYPRYAGVDVTGVISSTSGQAVVYRGTLNKTGQPVAVKVYKERDQWDECKTELKALLKLGDHPNVVALIDFFETPLPCIVMSLIQGETLFAHLRKNGAFPISRGISIAIGIASGLSHLHQGRFVHRDIKSLNIMIDESFNPILIDMGLGKETDRNRTHEMYSSSPKGTLLYLSPEMSNGSWSTATDVFAFGIVMWEIFSGREPYNDFEGSLGLMMQRIFDSSNPLRPSLSQLPREMDPKLVKLIQICWHPSPVFRPRMDRVVANLKDPSSSDFGIERAQAAFHQADTGKTGRLSIDQFSQFLRQLEPSLSHDQAKKIFEFVDADKSGLVELREFLEFWSQLDVGGLTRVLELIDKQVTPSPSSAAGPSAPPAPTIKLEIIDVRENWSVQEVLSALNQEGLSQYVSAFRDNNIHGPLLIELTDEEYEELGVKSRLHRTRIRKMHLPTSVSFRTGPSQPSSSTDQS